MSRQTLRPRGTILIYMSAAMVMFVGFVSLGLDGARVYLAKRQLQFAADAAARYGASALPDTTTATSQAISAAGYNTCDGNSVVITSSNIDFGTWDSTSATFTVLPNGSATPPNAIRVRASRTAANSNAVPLIFAGIVGRSTCDVHATSIASLSDSPYGIVGLNFVTMSGGASDSYYSASNVTGYSSAPQNSGTIASNGNITLNGGAAINGNALAGPGMTVNASPSAVSGTIGNLTQALSFPNVSFGNAASSNNNASIPSTYFSSSKDLTLNGGATLTLSSGTYFIRNLAITGGSSLQFLGPVTMYVTGSVSLSGGSVSTSANVPSNFRLYVGSSGTVTVSGSSTLYADVYAPQSDFTISGGGTLAGRIVALSITESGNSNLYYDMSLVGGAGASVFLAQ